MSVPTVFRVRFLRRGLALFLVGAVIVGCLQTWAQMPDPNVVGTLRGHTEPVYAVAYTPDGKFVLTGSFDKSLKIWDAATGKEVKTFAGTTGHQNLVLAVAINPEGTLFASGSSDNTARVWDFPTSAPLRALECKDGVLSVALSADGAKAFASTKDGTARAFTTADG
jgi:WD40 repeat protein